MEQSIEKGASAGLPPTIHSLLTGLSTEIVDCSDAESIGLSLTIAKSPFPYLQAGEL